MSSPISYGKAHLCKWLSGRLRNASVPESHLVSRSEWASGRFQIVCSLLDRCKPPLIVRSSAPSEDRVRSSQAGRYLSVGSVTTSAELETAVDAVFRSYSQKEPDDVLFVQQMVMGVDCVGVAFTADPETGSPYLIVNYAETDQTDAITSGRDSYSTWIALSQGARSPPLEALRGLPAVIAEIQELCGIQSLDVEFAVTREQLHVFQVRELAIKVASPPGLDVLGAATIEAVEDLRRLQRRADGLVGRSTAFGVMPDWNPAEIIGIKPRPLAISLYQELVTDSHWSERRGDYGYRRLVDIPLLHEVLGVPFIDVRASFNSLVSASLPDDLAANFIEAAIDRLSERRELHDKIEFAVLPTCYTSDLEATLRDRFAGAISNPRLGEIAEAIRALTCGLLENARDYDLDERRQVERLIGRRQQHSAKPTRDRLSALLADAATFGTTPFVGQARRAFVAMDILKSLVRDGAITHERFTALLASVDTVAGRLQRDKATMAREELLLTYGHLRPGTYDITAPRYDRLPQDYLAAPVNGPAAPPDPFSLELPEARAFEDYLGRLGANLSPDQFVEFATTAITAREETKFEFTKNISDSLELVASLCESHGFSRDDASFLRLNDLCDLSLGRAEMEHLIASRRREYSTACAAKLPMLIVEPEEMWSFNYGEGQPNYIGASTVIGPPLQWPTLDSLDDSVLLIENADPGFDWIFGTKISGFITMFGGPNSHMAIRAHELGVTAVVGAGPALFSRLRRAALLRIDPMVKKAEVIP